MHHISCSYAARTKRELNRVERNLIPGARYTLLLYPSIGNPRKLGIGQFREFESL